MDFFPYIRFRIPKISLTDLLDAGNNYSPFVLLENGIGLLRSGVPEEKTRSKLLYEFRLLGNDSQVSAKSGKRTDQ